MTSAIWRALSALSDGEIWVVGGSVRDWALGRPSKDLDIVLTGDPQAVGRSLADALDGHFFVMHPATLTARIALPGSRWIDLLPLHRDLDADLRRRDYTVNAMAAPLEAFTEAYSASPGPDTPPPPWLVDPTGGWQDLKARTLRLTGPDVLRDDPLRTLRGLRLSATLGFGLETGTEHAIKAHSPLLVSVSAERVRDEWLQILELRDPAPHVERAADLGLLDVVFPDWSAMEGVEQNAYHHLDVWQHTLEVMRQVTMAMASPEVAPPPEVARRLEEYLEAVVTVPHTRRGLLNAAVLLHDAGKPETRTVDESGGIHFYGHERHGSAMARAWASRWRLSAREREFVLSIVGMHMRPGALAASHVTPRAVHRFFRDAGNATPALLLLNVADRLSAVGESTTEDEIRVQASASWRLLDLWFEMRSETRLPLPLSGRDIMTAFGVPPGPQIGRILDLLREIHAETPFTDRETALLVARQWLPEPMEPPAGKPGLTGAG